jgi:hypothetical protein
MKQALQVLTKRAKRDQEPTIGSVRNRLHVKKSHFSVESNLKVWILPQSILGHEVGTTTLNIMPLSIMTLSTMTLSIKTLRKMTLSIMTLRIMTLSIMTLSKMTISIMTLSIMTYRIAIKRCDTQHKQHSA